METNGLSFWFDRTERLMEEQQSGKMKPIAASRNNYRKNLAQIEREQVNLLSRSADKPGVRRMQFSFIRYTVLIEKKI